MPAMRVAERATRVVVIRKKRRGISGHGCVAGMSGSPRRAVTTLVEPPSRTAYTDLLADWRSTGEKYAPSSHPRWIRFRSQKEQSREEH